MTAGPRILFVTADMGAGHREVAGELARRCGDAGADCATVDVIRESGRHGRRLQRTYRRLLTWAPWVYDAAMRAWARWPVPWEAFTARNAGPFECVLREAVERTVPDLVLSDFNLASQCLGRLVRRGQVHAPVATLVIDPGAHPYWVSRDVAAHLVPTRLTGTGLAGMGARGVRVVQPVLRPEFGHPPGRERARRRLGLPADRRIALLTAGSWAVGGLPRTLAAVRRAPETLVVVLCGRDEALRARLAGRADVIAVGWTSAVADHLAAADVVVDNAGGLTCWEALACGARVVLFNPLAGHGRVNVATLAELGCATWAHDADQLRALITAKDDAARRPALPDGEPAEHVVMALAGAGG